MSFHDVRFPEGISFGAVGGPRFKTTVVTTAGGLEQRNQNWEQVRAEYDVSQNVKKQEDLDELIEFFYARRGRAFGFRFKDWADYKLDNNIAVADGSTATFQLVKLYESAGVQYQRQITKPVSGTVVASAEVDLVGSSSYQWNLSGSGTGEHYLEAFGGNGQPPLTDEPPEMEIDGTSANKGTVGSLAQGEWDWADNDGLGYDTIYVRLSGDADPDFVPDGTVKAKYSDSNASVDATTGEITFASKPGKDAVVTASCEFDVPVRFDTDQMAISLEDFQVFSWGQIPLKELKNE